eukprot:1820155-Prymnesium_polylepis.1
MSSAPSAGPDPEPHGLRSRVDALWRARACSVTRGCAPSSTFLYSPRSEPQAATECQWRPTHHAFGRVSRVAFRDRLRRRPSNGL